MSLLPPPTTRVILVPSDGRPSREYVVGRGVLALLLLSGLLLAAAVGLVIGSYPRLQLRAAEADSLSARLAVAQGRDLKLTELQEELSRMQALQEQLLHVLGAGGLLPPDTAQGPRAAWAAGGRSASSPDSGIVDPLAWAAALSALPAPDLWPAGGYVTREFGPGDPRQAEAAHGGLDLAVPEGAAVRAAGAGLVTLAGWDDALGNLVEIRHGFGYSSVYGHCQRLAVQRGERVDRGQVVGYGGRTGQASAPHLHFEIWKDGEAVDPRGVLPGGPPR